MSSLDSQYVKGKIDGLRQGIGFVDTYRRLMRVFQAASEGENSHEENVSLERDLQTIEKTFLQKMRMTLLEEEIKQAPSMTGVGDGV